MFGALKRGFRSMASLILVRNVVGELQQKRTLAASRGFLATARLSCFYTAPLYVTGSFMFSYSSCLPRTVLAIKLLKLFQSFSRIAFIIIILLYCPRKIVSSKLVFQAVNYCHANIHRSCSHAA